MSEDAHIIEIDSIVLDGVDVHRPGAVRTLVGAETRRALFGIIESLSLPVAHGEVAIALEVGRSVEQAIKGGAGDA
jgi:hypothetical protein